MEKHFHAVQFYKDEQSLATTAAKFLADGISHGQPAIVIAPAAHAASINAGVAASGLDVDELRRTGELQLFDARKMLSAF